MDSLCLWTTHREAFFWQFRFDLSDFKLFNDLLILPNLPQFLVSWTLFISSDPLFFCLSVWDNQVATGEVYIPAGSLVCNE
jgi:hypothetical protein